MTVPTMQESRVPDMPQKQQGETFAVVSVPIIINIVIRVYSNSLSPYKTK